MFNCEKVLLWFEKSERENVRERSFDPREMFSGRNYPKHTDIAPSIFQLTKEGLFEVMVSYGQSTRSGSSLEVLHCTG